MELFSITMSNEFVLNRVKLTWHDMLFGIKENFINPNVAIYQAVDEIKTIDEQNTSKQYYSELLALASLFKNEPVLDRVSKLVELEPTLDEQQVKDKWLYLVLAWVYENQDKYKEHPLEIVEYIYADFGYPKGIAQFVRYMPSSETPLPSLKLNYSRLYRRWENYLKKQEDKYNRIYK